MTVNQTLTSKTLDPKAAARGESEEIFLEGRALRGLPVFGNGGGRLRWTEEALMGLREAWLDFKHLWVDSVG